MGDDPELLRSLENVCEPDPRNESFSVIGKKGYRTKTIEDHYLAISRIVLDNGVPEDIGIQFETAKNVYLYAWYAYRFYPVAQHQVLICLEYALRKKYGQELKKICSRFRKREPTLKPLLSYVFESGLVRNDHFEMWRHRAEVRARERIVSESINKMGRLGLDEIELADEGMKIISEDCDWDYLAILRDSLPSIRNHYAHGSSTLHNQVIGTFKAVSEILNQVWSAELGIQQPGNPE